MPNVWNLPHLCVQSSQRIDEAKSGGFSDPRNGAMLKFFNLIDIGERAGSGIPNSLRVWHDQKWTEPSFSQSFEPDTKRGAP